MAYPWPSNGCLVFLTDFMANCTIGVETELHFRCVSQMKEMHTSLERHEGSNGDSNLIFWVNYRFKCIDVCTQM